MILCPEVKDHKLSNHLTYRNYSASYILAQVVVRVDCGKDCTVGGWWVRDALHKIRIKTPRLCHSKTCTQITSVAAIILMK